MRVWAEPRTPTYWGKGAVVGGPPGQQGLRGRRQEAAPSQGKFPGSLASWKTVQLAVTV